MTAAEYQQYESDVAAFIALEQLTFISTGCADILADDWEPEATAEPWFSWKPCQCCGSTLGGNREYLHAYSGEQQVQFTICEDCVYYIEYGRLDDLTMLEIEQNGGK